MRSIDLTTIAATVSTTKEYTLLTKPGIVCGNALTMAAGFAMASAGSLSFIFFWKLLFAFSLVVASACVFNNYIDRHLDRKMERTRHRALALGLISEKGALLFGALLGLFGHCFLALLTNLLTLTAAFSGFFIYVLFYSFLKYRSPHATWIGSIAGAMPPVVGYCANGRDFDLMALILFLMIFLWQMPHFFAIALYRIEEYAAAAIPIVPIKKGVRKAKEQMLFYCIAFGLVSCLPTAIGRMGYGYLAVASILGAIWTGICLTGFRCQDDRLWGRKMFLFSLVTIVGLCATMMI